MNQEMVLIQTREEDLESKGFKISCRKTEYMDCNFKGYIERAETTVRIEAHEIPLRESFCYFGSIISKDREIDEDTSNIG